MACSMASMDKTRMVRALIPSQGTKASPNEATRKVERECDTDLDSANPGNFCRESCLAVRKSTPSEDLTTFLDWVVHWSGGGPGRSYF